MRLLCPHCRSELEMANHLAGQVQSCPRCQKPFRVPVPPPGTGTTAPGTSTPVAGFPGVPSSQPGTGAVPVSAGLGGPMVTPPVSVSATQPVSSVPPPQVSSYAPDQPSPTFPATTGLGTVIPSQPAAFTLPQPHPSPGYGQSVPVLVLRSHVVQIAQLIVLLGLAVLLFCPWLKIPPETGVLVSQTGFQVAFGRADGKIIDQRPTGKDTKASKESKFSISASFVGILYFFLVIVSCMLGVLFAAATYLDWPELRPYLRFRHLVMGGLGLLTALMLLLQVLTGLPAIGTWTQTGILSSETLKKFEESLKPDSDTERWAIIVLRDMSDAPGNYTSWAWGLQWSLLLALVLVALVVLDFWLQRRSGLLPPRLLLEK